MALAASFATAAIALAWRLHGTADAQGAAAPASVPVGIAAAASMDVPLLLDGLGTVQAYNTVTIHTRVDGELEQVLFTEGQHVHVGDVLARLDARPFQAAYDQAVAKRATDEAQLAGARLDLERFAALAQREYATRQQADDQRALVRQLEATVAQDQAAIDSARTQLGYATIASPLDGIAGIRLVDQGNIVHAADATGLVVITQVQPISMIFSLPAQQISDVQHAMAAGPLTVTALDQGSGRPLAQGRLMLIDNQIDQTTGTMRLKAEFPNADTALWPGQFVNARLLLRTDRGVTTVPSSAIQRGPDGTFVYVVRPDRTVAVQAVRVARFGAGHAVIAEGLQPGTEVVATGQSLLAPGTRVQPAAAPAAAGAPAS